MLEPSKKEFGIQLTDEVKQKMSFDHFIRFSQLNLTNQGVDTFKAKVNIEVQWVLSEMCIAAIERNGGMITTKYYDFHATQAMSDPFKFFKSGKQKN